MKRLSYVNPVIHCITFPNDDLIRTSNGEPNAVGFAWESDWSKVFGDGNEYGGK